jgi:YesN/AraC family two-component response regulator
MTENELLRSELESISEKLEELESQSRVTTSQQVQSPKDWIRENLEEAQQLIDSIVGIKGITENPIKAAIKLGISQPQPEVQENYHERQRQQNAKIHQIQIPHVSTSASIVPSNEELFGY